MAQDIARINALARKRTYETISRLDVTKARYNGSYGASYFDACIPYPTLLAASKLDLANQQIRIQDLADCLTHHKHDLLPIPKRDTEVWKGGLKWGLMRCHRARKEEVMRLRMIERSCDLVGMKRCDSTIIPLLHARRNPC